MKKIVVSLHFVILFGLLVSASNTEAQRPTVTVLYADMKSASGVKVSYPTDGFAKTVLDQATFPFGAVLTMYTHPSSLLVHLTAGAITSIRSNGDAVTYRAGNSYIKAPNPLHEDTDTGKDPTILYAVFATAEFYGPLTVFEI